MIKTIKKIKSYISRFRWLSTYLGRQTSFNLIWSELFSSQETVRIKFGSFPSILIRPNTTDILMSIQVLGNKEYDFPIANSPKLIIDAGANIGASSIFFRHRFPDAEIIAIEPDPQNFELLKLNVKDDKKCTFIHAALWNTYTSLILDYSENAECAVMTKEKVQNKNSSFTVSTITIPEIIKKHGPIDILKLDIEGAEFNLFDENAVEWLRLVNVIMIEFHDRFVPGCSRRFFNMTNDFPLESVKGENFCAARQNWLKRI